MTTVERGMSASARDGGGGGGDGDDDGMEWNALHILQRGELGRTGRDRTRKEFAESELGAYVD